MIKKAGIRIFVCMVSLALVLHLGVMTVAAAAIEESHIAVVHNEEELREAVGNDWITKIIFEEDNSTGGNDGEYAIIYLMEPITIDRDVEIIASEENPFMIKVLNGFPHIRIEGEFIVEASVNILFENVVLDGDGIGGGIQGGAKDITIAGAVIQNCLNFSYRGCGIWIYAEDTVIITDCIITNNSAGPALSYGGGMHLDGSDIAITGCTITGNYVGFNGGGVYIQRSDTVTITDCTITDNFGGIGGGIHIAESDTTIITDCTISDNSTTTLGGGISINGNDVAITNCNITDNSAGHGGGMLIGGNDTITVTNCKIADNYADSGGGMYVGGSDTVTITDSVITDNSANNGGGVFLPYDYYDRGNVFVENCEILNNSAEGAGGGIWIDDLRQLFVDEATVFQSNTAGTGYFMTDPDDIALHQQQIQTTHFTEPFEYGYNNYDIGYTKGILMEEVAVNFYLDKGDTVPYHTAYVWMGYSISPYDLPDVPYMEGREFLTWLDNEYNRFDPDAVFYGAKDYYAAWHIITE